MSHKPSLVLCSKCNTWVSEARILAFDEALCPECDPEINHDEVEERHMSVNRMEYEFQRREYLADEE